MKIAYILCSQIVHYSDVLQAYVPQLDVTRLPTLTLVDLQV